MPKVTGVYKDRKGRYCFKAATGFDPRTGTYGQVTRRGFTSAAEAAEARAAFLTEQSAPPPSPVASLSVTELVERYLDECEDSNRLGPKTLFDYRHYLEDYVRPWIVYIPVGDVDAEVIASWHHTLAERGSKKSGRGLAPNTIRLAWAPLNGAFKQATARGQVPASPLALVARPRLPRPKPKHWTPAQARSFLAMHEGDRMQPLWAFLLSSGLRIGELVWLRWPNVDLDQRLVRIKPVVFHCTSGKDRTGLLATLINLIIGVSMEDALTDFEHSALELATVRSDMRSRYPEVASLPQEVVDRIAGVDRSWVLEALTEVDALPDPEPWLDSIGADAQVRDTIRQHLIH